MRKLSGHFLNMWNETYKLREPLSRDKKVNSVLLGLVLGLLIIVAALLFYCFASTVEAAGVTSTNTTVSAALRDGYWTTYKTPGDQRVWSLQVLGGATGQQIITSSGIYVGWNESELTKWQIFAGAYGFDAPSFNGTIVSASVYLYLQDVINEGSWTPYLALYKGEPTGDNLTTTDYNKAYVAGSNKASTYEYISAAMEGGYVKFDIDPDEYAYLAGNAKGRVWFWVMTTNHAINYEPTQVGVNKTLNILFQGQGEAHPAILEVRSVAAGDTRTSKFSTNAAVTTENLTGVVDNITWESPRAAYADEKICLNVTGTPGTPLQLELVTSDSSVLTARNDWIRVDGHYYWQASVSKSSKAFIRIIDRRSGVVSVWGHVAPSPEGQDWNTTMCVDTSLGHYRQPMSYFITGSGKLMFIHWKTNIDGDTELGDSYLDLYRLGLSADVAASYCLNDLATDYYKNIADNNDMLHWRYAVFTPYAGSGFNDYDDMVMNLNLPANAGNYGFYEPVITYDSTVISTAVDAYWYIPSEKDGIIIGNTRASGVTTVSISIGDLCKAKTDLNQVELSWVDSSGNSLGPSGIGGQCSTTLTTLTIPEPTTVGNYFLRAEFADPDTDFIYVREISLNIASGVEPGAPGATKDLWTRFVKLLGDYGLDTKIGRWMLLIIAMTIAFIVFHKSEILRVAVPLCIAGLFIVAGWIDVWIVVILALGVGLTLYQMFRKKVQGESEK